MPSLYLDFVVDLEAVGLVEVTMSFSFADGLLGDSEQDQVELGGLPPFKKYVRLIWNDDKATSPPLPIVIVHLTWSDSTRTGGGVGASWSSSSSLSRCSSPSRRAAAAKNALGAFTLGQQKIS